MTDKQLAQREYIIQKYLIKNDDYLIDYKAMEDLCIINIFDREYFHICLNKFKNAIVEPINEEFCKMLRFFR